MFRKFAMLTAFAIGLLASAVPSICFGQKAKGSDNLVGAWRGQVQFTTGAFAETKDLEFMYVFTIGGTMTESSNYDAAPPVPPAYGIWKKVGIRKYEAKYQFFQSKAVSSADELVKGGGWAPDGYGILSQNVTLSADGNSFDSSITLELFDRGGRTIAGGGEANAKGKRIAFEGAARAS
jgi:hypothetical protein